MGLITQAPLESTKVGLELLSILPCSPEELGQSIPEHPYPSEHTASESLCSTQIPQNAGERVPLSLPLTSEPQSPVWSSALLSTVSKVLILA